MKCAKCFDDKKSRVFFIASELSDEDNATLFDILHDNGIKLKKCSQSEVTPISITLQDETECLFFPKDCLNFEEVLQMIDELPSV